MKTKCSICLEEELENGCKLVDCLHTFCTKCIKKFHEKKDTCPLCKKKFNKIMLIDSGKRVKFEDKKKQTNIWDLFNLYEFFPIYINHDESQQIGWVRHLKYIKNNVLPHYLRHQTESFIITTKQPEKQDNWFCKFTANEQLFKVKNFSSICTSCLKDKNLSCTHVSPIQSKKI